MSMQRILISVCFALAPLGLSGCVVDDIHTEMQLTNQRLDTVQGQLEVVSDVNKELQTINDERLTRLASIERSLASIDESLKKIDTQLSPIGERLASVDQHLASLRKTINNIDSTIPFLSVSGDDDDEAEALEAEAPATVRFTRAIKGGVDYDDRAGVVAAHPED